MEYIKDGGTLPVPINIIPTPKSFVYMFKKIKGIFSKKKEKPKHDRCDMSDQFHLVNLISLFIKFIVVTQ